MRLPALIVLACVSGLCQLPEGVYRIGNGVSAPTVIAKVDPEYSEEARIARLSGTIRFSVVVGEDGTVHDVHANKSLGLGLDEKATEAIGAWHLKPGLKNGMPVPVAVDVEVNLRLLPGPSEWGLARAVFNPPEGATRPVVTEAPYSPSFSYPRPTNGSVGISFDVNQTAQWKICILKYLPIR